MWVVMDKINRTWRSYSVFLLPDNSIVCEPVQVEETCQNPLLRSRNIQFSRIVRCSLNPYNYDDLYHQWIQCHIERTVGTIYSQSKGMPARSPLGV